MVGQSVAAYQLRQLPSLSSHGSCSSAFQARRPACRHIKLFAAPACEQHRPQQSPTAAPSRNGAGSAETSSAAAQQFAAVSEGRRSKGWQQRNTADPLPLWGSFIKVGPQHGRSMCVMLRSKQQHLVPCNCTVQCYDFYQAGFWLTSQPSIMLQTWCPRVSQQFAGSLTPLCTVAAHAGHCHLCSDQQGIRSSRSEAAGRADISIAQGHRAVDCGCAAVFCCIDTDCVQPGPGLHAHIVATSGEETCAHVGTH